MEKVYIVVYREDSTPVAQNIAFSSYEKALAFVEQMKDRYIENMRAKFKRDIPESFRDHLKLDILEFEVV